MTEKRCIANQIEAEEIFGDRASEFNSCPCETGLALRNNHKPGGTGIPHVTSIVIPSSIREPETIKEETMAKKPRGTCANCLRPNMAITNSLGTGLCGSCMAAIAGLPPGNPERAEKLRAAAKKYAALPKMHSGMKPTLGAKPRIKPEIEGMPDKYEMPDSEAIALGYLHRESKEDIIILHFQTETDHKLLEAIETLAKQYRRTPDQQILWMVQNEKQLHEELVKEAANAL